MSTAGKTDSSKKSRRAIANHNERRRMQNINTGFEQLRDILPAYRDTAASDRLSKVSLPLCACVLALPSSGASSLFDVADQG
jgi:hypothetical protein